MHQDATWYGGRPQLRRHFVRWGPNSGTPPPLKGHSPQFSANARCGQMAGWIKMPLDMEVGIGPGCVRWEPSYPQEKTPTHTQFLGHVYCGHTAGRMTTPLATEVDLGPGHTVLNGVPALHERGIAPPPLLGPCLLWPRSPISATAELLFLYCQLRVRCYPL